MLSQRARATAALFVSAACSALLIARGGPPSDPLNLGLIVVAFAGYAAALVIERRARVLSGMLVIGVCAALFVEAAVVPPRNSYDVRAYAAYGRLVSTYHVNPYRVAPSEFSGDPFVQRLAPQWFDAHTVYGPAFTAISAGAMAVVDTHDGARLFFQGLAALAMLGVLLLLWRRTRDPAVVLFAGLHPVVATSIVNGGHNDALVGLAILAGVLLLIDRRDIAASLVFGLGALVKIVGVFPLLAVALWCWWKRGRAAAARVAVPGLVLVLLSYAVVGIGPTISALRETARFVTRFSIARAIARDVVQGSQAAARVISIAAIVMLLVTALVVWRYSSQRSVVIVAGASLVVYLLLAGYVLPWYVAWVLPVLALERTSPPARVAAITGGLLMLVYWATLAQYPGAAWFVSATAARLVFPIFCAGAAAYLVADSRARRIELPERETRKAADPEPSAPG